jgi:N-methylhydantoinase A
MPILGVDTGGTFTDFFLIADNGSIAVYKLPSTRDDPARAILDGLAEMAAQPHDLVHGSTVATNAIIERKGARTALITTRGFRDVLAIGRQTRPRLYDLSPHREPPLVPDDLRFEANERLDHRGEVVQPLDVSEVEALLDRVEATGVESLAVCFLFSFLNPQHERLVADAARKRGVPTSASYEVLPEHREYERTSTTVANAYVAPVMERYLSRLEKDARKHGINRLRVMSSNGGSISPQAAGRLAIRTALSGPAGGVAGAFALASAAGFDRIITLDMGGTSTDVALCPGRILERDETLVGGLPVRGPTVDVLSVGAGGGSIARFDEGGALRVGPESAGADPGPACYGRGAQPTVTDAHVVLGRIAPAQFLGGRMTIRPELSVEAMKRIAAPFGGDSHRAAAAVLRVANANMERALRQVSVERGHDQRDFTLVAFGGAGPLHACDLAAALRIPRVLVPQHPGVLSALGMATAPVVKDLSAAVIAVVGSDASVGAQGLAPLRDDLELRGRKELEAERFSLEDLTRQTFLEMRYAGQSYELSVPVESLAPDEFVPRFHAAHHARYGHSDPTRAVEIVTLRVKLVLPSPLMGSVKGEMGKGKQRVASPALIKREIWFDGKPARTAMYERAQLAPGDSFRGPALVVQMDSTTAVPPDWRADVDAAGNLVLEIA